MQRVAARRWVWGIATCALVSVVSACAVGDTDRVAPEADVPTSDSTESEVTVERTLSDDRIVESSGLAPSNVHEGVLYTHNDSDDGPYVYAVGTDGGTRARLEIVDAPARDWEAVATLRSSEGSRVYVGDIGDNRSTWRSVRVHVFAEPERLTNQVVQATRYDLVYPDGPRDAEALLVSPTTGRMYIVSKRITGAAIYLAPEQLSATSINRLQRWRSAPAIVTDGAFSPDGERYVLRSYFRAYVYDSRTGQELAALPLPTQPQGESVAWTSDGKALLIGSEGADSQILRVPIP